MAATLRNPRYRRSAQAPNAFAGRQCNPRAERDMEFGGNYQLTDIVDELGVVGRYRVRLHDRSNGILARETWSNANGVYSFTNIANLPGGYYVLALDHTAPQQNAAIADLPPLSLMP